MREVVSYVNTTGKAKACGTGHGTRKGGGGRLLKYEIKKTEEGTRDRIRGRRDH